MIRWLRLELLNGSPQTLSKLIETSRAPHIQINSTSDKGVYKLTKTISMFPNCDEFKHRILCHWSWRVWAIHRHPRGIDCSLNIVGRPTTSYSHGAACRGKSIHWPRIQHQSVFYGSWQHNYYCQQRQAGRQAGPMSGLFLFMSLERSHFQAILGGDLEPGRLLMNAKARIRWNGINFTKY